MACAGRNERRRALVVRRKKVGLWIGTCSRLLRREDDPSARRCSVTACRARQQHAKPDAGIRPRLRHAIGFARRECPRRPRGRHLVYSRQVAAHRVNGMARRSRGVRRAFWKITWQHRLFSVAPKCGRTRLRYVRAGDNGRSIGDRCRLVGANEGRAPFGVCWSGGRAGASSGNTSASFSKSLVDW